MPHRYLSLTLIQVPSERFESSAEQNPDQPRTRSLLVASEYGRILPNYVSLSNILSGDTER